MARHKTKAKATQDKSEPIDFGFFQNAVEKEGTDLIGGEQVKDPKPNKSGSYNLDYDLTVPFPGGRITEIFGEEGTCKTTLSLEIAGQALLNGKTVLYVNMEKNLNLSLIRTVRTLRPVIDEAIAQIGSAKDQHCPLWIVNALTGEGAFGAMRKFAEMVPNGIAILDSVDAAQPEAVLSGDIGDMKVGNLPKLMSDAMRKLIGAAESNNVALIFINQMRDKITMYGDPKTTSGGHAIKYYASQRVRLFKPRKADMIVDAEGERIGVIIRYQIAKNKVAPDGNEGAFPILFKNGIFREQELVTRCCDFGVLRMGGKGGKQVYLPALDRKTGDYIVENGERKESCMSQFNAARRLLMDSKLLSKLETELTQVLNSTHHAVDEFVNEVQDTE